MATNFSRPDCEVFRGLTISWDWIGCGGRGILSIAAPFGCNQALKEFGGPGPYDFAIFPPMTGPADRNQFPAFQGRSAFGRFGRIGGDNGGCSLHLTKQKSALVGNSYIINNTGSDQCNHYKYQRPNILLHWTLRMTATL